MSKKASKANRKSTQIKLVSTADTGFYYIARRNMTQKKEAPPPPRILNLSRQHMQVLGCAPPPMEFQGGTGGARRLGAKRDVSPMTATSCTCLFFVCVRSVFFHLIHQSSLISFSLLLLSRAFREVVVGLAFFLFCPRGGGGDAARFFPVRFSAGFRKNHDSWH